ncbi:MAG: hypothetical protein KAT48_08255 [Bacteroidales bacterium]|nr:hypothetical protein [Bacteroidales bacterium]
MISLEDKISRNKEMFDHAEPSDDHFEKFGRKLSEFNKPQKWKFNRGLFLKIAASILILISISITLNYVGKNNGNNLFLNNSVAEAPVELQEIQLYYTNLTDDKLQQIDQLAGSSDEGEKIKRMIRGEVEEIKLNTNELENEYVSGANDGRTMSAIVNNYRIITNLLDHIINDLNKTNQ